jgi:DNA replication protein DnaC
MIGMATESYGQLVIELRKLRLPAIAEMLDSYTKQAVSVNMSYMDFLSGLVFEEVRSRERNGIENRIKSARFPVLKSLDDFDYGFQPSVNKKKLMELCSLRFIDNKENVLLLGPPGVGKTHMATGLGVKACESGYKVLFTTLNDMISVLMSSMADNSFPAKLRTFVQPSLLIIDEVGYLPLPKEGANFLFHVVSKRYEIGSIILTSNKSFTHWGEVLGDNVIASAILDRLLHHSTVFNIRGDSYRLREKKELTKEMGSNVSGKEEKEPD